MTVGLSDIVKQSSHKTVSCGNLFLARESLSGQNPVN